VLLGVSVGLPTGHAGRRSAWDCAERVVEPESRVRYPSELAGGRQDGLDQLRARGARWASYTGAPGDSLSYTDVQDLAGDGLGVGGGLLCQADAALLSVDGRDDQGEDGQVGSGKGASAEEEHGDCEVHRGLSFHRDP
jgi:hypothetical protein